LIPHREAKNILRGCDNTENAAHGGCMRSLHSVHTKPGDHSPADSSTSTDIIIFHPTVKPQDVFAAVSHVQYLPEYAEPETGLFVWSYTVRFGNFGDQPIRLLGRKWLIRDGKGKIQDVLAAGVGGQQPTLQPGDMYAYESGVPLSTPRGDMTGAFGFRTANGTPLIIETRRFELQAPENLPTPITHPRLSFDNEQDVSVFASHLTQYRNEIAHDRPAELRISHLKEMSSTGRRHIIRYLLHDFPFNQSKETLVPFRKLAQDLPNISARDIFISRTSRSQKLDIVIKWWPDPDDIEFLESYPLAIDATTEPNLTGVRLLAAYEVLQKIDLSDPALTDTDRLRLAGRLVATYQRLQKQKLQDVQLGSTQQLRLAHRIVKAHQRQLKRPAKNP
jgi:ApaG protein